MDKLVYTSEKGKIKERKMTKKSTSLPQPGPTKMRLEKKGRGGKQVTVLFNLPYSDDEAKVLMKEIQQNLGCGAAFKDDQIQLRGDVRDRLSEIFKQKNQRLIRAGG